MVSSFAQTQTLQLQTRPTLAERPYDFLYDPIHTLSSEVDHNRASFKARADPTRIQRVPLFKTMFSCLPHKPKQTLRLNQVDPVPPFIARGWRGQVELAREQLSYVTKTNYMPDVQIPAKSHQVAQVDGLDRYKFFRRPIIPFLQKLPPYVVLAPVSRPEAGLGAAVPAGMGGPPDMRTAQTQTDFRESETQTDPWTPDYVIQPGAQPELLALSKLCWKKGLPGGLAEVEMVERARAKRAWEKTLPALSDTSHLQQRMRMMEEQEAREWAWREEEIQKTQAARLEVLKNMLLQRESDLSALNDKRLEHLWNKKQAEKERQVKQLRTKHVKALRKLNEKRKNVEGKLQRREIIKEYYDHGSQVYAPQTRVGQFLDVRSEQFKVRSKHLNSYPGLNEMEVTLPRSVLQPKARAPIKDAAPVGSSANKEERRAKILDSVHYDIQREKELSLHPEPAKPLRLLERVEKPTPRPPTPTIDAPSEGLEEEELSVILLQQLIRGRAVQLKMREGKRRRLELIRELRASHALQTAERKLKREEKKQIELLQKTAESSMRRSSLLQAGLETHSMDELGTQLDFLSKELVRLQEERRIQAFVMLAERERRIREAEESGRRQTEERRRRSEDEMIKQIMKVHQDTVDGYLEQVILSSVGETADEQARERIQLMSRQVNQAAQEFEGDHSALEGSELVADLLHAFLLPEVEKSQMRERVRISQRRFLVAAHSALHGNADAILNASTEEAESTATRDGDLH